MNRDALNRNCKAVLRKIKIQWGVFSNDDIRSLMNGVEDKERDVIIQDRFRKNQSKLDD